MRKADRRFKNNGGTTMAAEDTSRVEAQGRFDFLVVNRGLAATPECVSLGQHGTPTAADAPAWLQFQNHARASTLFPVEQDLRSQVQRGSADRVKHPRHAVNARGDVQTEEVCPWHPC